MTTKKLYSLTIILIALGFAAIGIMISFMPDTVPIHYNARGEMDGMGSRYTYLVFPAISAISAFIMLPLSKSRTNPTEEKILLFTGIFMVLLFDLMGIFFAYLAIDFEPGSAADINNNVFKLTFIAFGVLLVLLGNFMPKFRRNHFSGLRTKWSLASDSVWQKSNRFSGIAAVVCGILMIILAAVLSGTAVIVSCISLTILWTAASIIASYKYYKAEQ